MVIDEHGWLDAALREPSPNCDERPAQVPVRLVVVHAISLPPGEFGGQWITDLFLNRLDPSAHPYFAQIHELRVSAHFLIRRDGVLVQYVSCGQRAWHAGVSTWRDCARCNDFSVGVELEGCDDKPFDDVQYRVLNALLAALHARYPIEDVVGHSNIAPGRKTDPGPFFAWSDVQAPIVLGKVKQNFLA